MNGGKRKEKKWKVQKEDLNRFIFLLTIQVEKAKETVGDSMILSY